MLGEQLLKNDCVALVELIKNSYDADASRVEVLFKNFTNDKTNMDDSSIIIMDDGSGMSLETVQKSWMNPATPTKYLSKQKGNLLSPVKKRVIQGEKGIGRFALLKLANKITVTTRTPDSNNELVIRFDFTLFDNDFLKENGQEKEIFLDELKIDWDEQIPKKFTGESHGTIIKLESLKGSWNDKLFQQFTRDISNLTDPISRLTHNTSEDNFGINIVYNDENLSVENKELEYIKGLIDNKSVFHIEGTFQNENNALQYKINENTEKVSLEDERIKGLWLWRQRNLTTNQIKENKSGKTRDQEYTCGNFQFQFYIFDFTKGLENKYLLTQHEKNLLKNHRVYLYRDGVRVYPYGDPNDDWLNIDTYRGVGRAGDYFSNDQIIGWIDISQKENPLLIDKTNREGLIEIGGASDDLVFLIGVILTYIKRGHFARYLQKEKQKKQAKVAQEGALSEQFVELNQTLKDIGQTKLADKVTKLTKDYENVRHFLTQRAEITEDLAGVGLSVEMASHDIMLLMGRAQSIGIELAQLASQSSINELHEKADMLVGVLQRISIGMKDVQSLFRSTRRRRKILKIEPILDKIHGIYSGLLDKHKIYYQKRLLGTSPLVAKSTDGVIMQALINLFDNSVYWLETKSPPDPREIIVTLDSDNGELIFSDNGPGVDLVDKPYIFEAFFTGKGQEGRGLGLYIARQLLERNGYTIELNDTNKYGKTGATFIINFLIEED
ncbi:MAG: ATP-binding protein [Rhodobacteraceae bacterium]|nr:ATP-binding protein [Paracoccaceae bacterium]